MKRANFCDLEPEARFQLDHQWWVKVDKASARHASFDFIIDLTPRALVHIKGDEPVIEARVDDGRKAMRKREGRFFALGLLLESLNWF